MFGQIALSSLLLAATIQVNQTDTPVEFITRAETVMELVLARTPDIPAIKNTNFFPDVPKGIWHEAFMLYAQKMGIISAEAKTNLLKPSASVTRAEFLKMLTFTFGAQIDYPHNFSDVPKSAWYEQYAGLAERYRLFNLKSPSLLEPQRVLTRDEAKAAIDIFKRIQEGHSAAPTIERGLASEQAQAKLKLYTVISTRRINVPLVDAEAGKVPLVKKIELPQTLPDMRTQILMLVNEARLKQNLVPLTYSNQLEQSAQAYADKMSAEGFFTHIAPDGETLKDRVSRTGFYDRTFSNDCLCVKGYALGENLARGQKTPKEAFEAWMKSPSHREAILNGDYTHTGIGAKSGVWVQHFGGVIMPLK